jgi:hypothetical protein
VLTAGDQIALYTPLYKGDGVLIGLASIDTSKTPATLATVAGSELRHVKLDTSDRLFPDGFDTQPIVRGELYVRPAANTPVLPAVGVAFSAAYGNLGLVAVQNQGLSIDNRSKVTATAPNIDKVKVTLKPATGLFSGSFTTGNPVKTYKFSGLILPTYLVGAGGVFVGLPTAGTPVETGSVALQ